MADTENATTRERPWLYSHAVVHVGDQPDTRAIGHDDGTVIMRLGYPEIYASGTLDQLQAFVTAQQGQLDRMRTAQALAAEAEVVQA